MKKKNIIIIAGAIIVVVVVILIACQLLGAPATSQQETLDLIQKNEMIEIEIAVPKDEEQGELKSLDWIILSELTSYQDTLRVPVEGAFYIKVDQETGEKTGYFYRDEKGNTVKDNSLKNILTSNQLVAQMLDNEDTLQKLSDAACNTYADLEADDVTTNAMLALNGYFNLLPDGEPSYANPNSTLTRAEFMTMVFRADNMVDNNLTVNKDFESLVGKSEYNIYAQGLADKTYLSITDKSLNDKTYVGTISRAEAVYMLMNHYFADELKSIDISKAKLEDATDGGNIVEKQNFTDKTGANALALNYALNNPDKGVPTDIYKALVLAESKGVIDSATEWDSGITKADSIEMLVNIYKSLPIEQTYGDIVHEDGSLEYVKPDTGLTLEEYDKKKEEGTLTKEDMLSLGLEDMSLEEFYKRGEDGCLYGDVVYTDENITYILLDDGTKIFPGDKYPDGATYGGRTPEDKEFMINREY